MLQRVFAAFCAAFYTHSGITSFLPGGAHNAPGGSYAGGSNDWSCRTKVGIRELELGRRGGAPSSPLTFECLNAMVAVGRAIAPTSASRRHINGLGCQCMTRIAQAMPAGAGVGRPAGDGKGWRSLEGRPATPESVPGTRHHH